RAEEDASSPSTQFKKPSTPVEEVLLGIWSELLGSDHIGVDDDFFDAGGHSLLAMRLNSRLRDAFKVDLPLRAVFESPSVAGLARSVESLMGNGRRSLSPQIVRVARDQPLPLSFSQQRLWFIDQMEPGTPTYNIPVAIKVRGPLSLPTLESVLSEIVARQESLRSRVWARGGRPFVGLEK